MIVTEDCCLQYYDTDEPVELHCDTSMQGAGTCLMQPRNTEEGTTEFAPVAYASKALTSTEQRYSNIERELLAVVYGVERFRTYLVGRPFKVVTDHKPLRVISTKNLTQAPPRIQRLLLRVQGYDMEVEYKPGKNHIVPDWLSRAPNNNNKEQVQLDARVDFISFSPDKLVEIQQHTKRDANLQALKAQIMVGWPQAIKQLDEQLKTLLGLQGQTVGRKWAHPEGMSDRHSKELPPIYPAEDTHGSHGH